MEKPAASQEPTPDEICGAILKMMSTLHILDAISRKGAKVPFAKNIREALDGFDKPDIRNELVERLYHPEKYTSPQPQ
jgi:hypothetical protein